MLSIHSYEVVHEEFVNDDVLIFLFDQIKGGMFCVLLKQGWKVDELIPFLKPRRGIKS